jgi:hypothetical protein
MPNTNLIGSTPVPIIPSIGVTPQAYLLGNADPTLPNIYIGTDSSLSPGSSSAFLLEPGGALTISSAQTWYACTDAGGEATISIMPGATSWSPATSQIADVIAPLAAAIAIQIAQTGVSLLAAPSLLYNVQSISPGIPGMIGATIVGPNYGLPETQNDTAITDWNTNVGRVATCGKVFYKDSSTWPTAIDNKLQPYLDNNMTCYICLQPAFNPPTNSDKTKLNTFLNMVKTAGLKAVVVLWQELGKPSGMTSTLFTAMMQFYASTVNTYYDLAMIYSGDVGCSTAAAAWFPGTGNQYVKRVLCDYYGDRYPGGKFDQAGGAMSVADANNLPFGLGEIGKSASSPNNPPSTSVLLTYMGYILSVFSGRLQSGKTNDAIMWWNGGGPITGSNAPLFPDDVINANDPLIPSIQSLFDTLTQQSSGGSAVTIAGGGNTILAPITPSPGGGFANATFMSYDITLRLVTSAASTNPFVTVLMSWYNTDSPTAEAVEKVAWHVPLGATGTTGTLITGKGPMFGQFMQVKLINRDSVTVTVLECQINGNGRNNQEHDWDFEAAGSVAVPGYTLAGAGPVYSNVLGSVQNQNINPGASLTFLLGMFAGEVSIRCGSTSSQVEFSLIPQPTSQFSTAPIAHELINQTGPAGEQEFLATLIFPRGCVLLTLTNDDTVAHSASAEIIALR